MRHSFPNPWTNFLWKHWNPISIFALLLFCSKKSDTFFIQTEDRQSFTEHSTSSSCAFLQKFSSETFVQVSINQIPYQLIHQSKTEQKTIVFQYRDQNCVIQHSTHNIKRQKEKWKKAQISPSRKFVPFAYMDCHSHRNIPQPQTTLSILSFSI